MLLIEHSTKRFNTNQQDKKGWEDLIFPSFCQHQGVFTMSGLIHSIETTGMVDGPGIRYMIFTQGCLLRCQYCHNPDSWDLAAGKEMSVSELVMDIQKYIPYMKASGGGVTVSGGEPLLQMEFLTELFKELKKLDIHTAIDSSGGCYSSSASFQSSFEALLEVTDLFLVDLKQMNEERHKSLTGVSNRHIFDFAMSLSDRRVPMWIRHVLVPGKTDREDDLTELAHFISGLQSVERIEILPYHRMGMYKWEELGLDYPLGNTPSPSEDETERARKIVQESNPEIPIG